MIIDCKYCGGTGKLHDYADAFDDHEIDWKYIAQKAIAERDKFDQWNRESRALLRLAEEALKRYESVTLPLPIGFAAREALEKIRGMK